MHAAAMRWASRWVPAEPVTVLDVGGRNINGTARDLFNAISYLSIDLFAGRGVDIVGDFTTYEGDTVDVVVCLEVAEHTEKWPLIIENAANHLTPGGLFIFTAAGPGRAPHSGIDGNKLQAGEWYQNIDPSDLRCELDKHFASCEVDVAGEDVRAVAWR